MLSNFEVKPGRVQSVAAHRSRNSAPVWKISKFSYFEKDIILFIMILSFDSCFCLFLTFPSTSQRFVSVIKSFCFMTIEPTSATSSSAFAERTWAICQENRNVLLLKKQILNSLSLLKDLALHTVNMMNQL